MAETSAPGGLVLVIDDDPAARTLVSTMLEVEGYSIAHASDAATAERALERLRPDIVLLDVMLGGPDGFKLLDVIRDASEVPVIMVTALDDEVAKIDALRRGADDYVVKPFSPGELSARVDAVLRRGRRACAEPVGAPLRFGDLVIDGRRREVQVRGEPVELTAREFDLLSFLAAAPEQVFSREQLLRSVWDSSSEWQEPSTVTEHIRRLRLKVEPDPARPRWLHTVRGVGYRFSG